MNEDQLRSPHHLRIRTILRIDGQPPFASL